MGKASWRGQTFYTLAAIDQRGTSKHMAKRSLGCLPGEAVPGIFSNGYLNTVFDRAMTFCHWLEEQHPEIRQYGEVDKEIVTEYVAEKTETCQPATIRTILACLRKLQEGAYARHWICEDIVPAEWALEPRRVHRGAYAPDEAQAIAEAITACQPQYAQALRFILSSGARIDEVFHLRADKIFSCEKRVELLGKGGKTRRIQVLSAAALLELDLARRFVYLEPGNERTWKKGLEDIVRETCDRLNIHRRGVHGFRGAAATEFLRRETTGLGFSESEGRQHLAMWLGHNPHRTEVTFAYVPKP